MAANTGIIQGRTWLYTWPELLLRIQRPVPWTPTLETRDRATKDTGKWASKVGGLLSWEISRKALRCYGSGIL
jgi:hypothetical protein